MQDFLSQAKKMKEEAMKVQEELKASIFEGTSGGGAVSIKINGVMEVKEVKINPEILKEDTKMVEDLVTSALNSALNQLKEETTRKMSFLASGLNLPGLF